MINWLFRLLLTFNATSLLFIIYAVQKEIILFDYIPSSGIGISWNEIISYVGYIVLLVLMTALSLSMSNRLGCDEFKQGEITSIEHANNSFLPSYLGYFFVALSIGNTTAFWVVYSILFVFTFLSQALYFNPLFLLFRYEFYNVKTNSGMSLFLISKNRYKTPTDIVIKKAYRINNYTFIERE